MNLGKMCNTATSGKEKGGRELVLKKFDLPPIFTTKSWGLCLPLLK